MAEIQSLIEKKSETMESVRRAFASAVEVFVNQWYEDEVKRVVVANPDKVKALGSEKLSKMKIELNEIKGKTAEVVDKHLSERSLWFHLDDSNFKSDYFCGYDTHSGSGQKGLDHAIRRILGSSLGTLLNRHTLVDFGSNSCWENNGASVRYKYGITWSHNMDKTTSEYEAHCRELMKLKQDVKKLKQDKAAAEASDLWDKA